MRVNKMKNVLRKVGAFALAFMMAVQPAGGMDAGMKETKADTYDTSYAMKIEQDGVETTNPSLEKGDEFTVKISRSENLDNVLSIKGYLRFYTKDGSGNYTINADDYFKEFRKEDATTPVAGAKVEYDNAIPRWIKLSYATKTSTGTDPFLAITVRVKRAVDNLKIVFGECDRNGIEVMLDKGNGIAQKPSLVQQNAVKEVTNSLAASRKLSFTVEGNGTEGRFQVPLKSTKNSRAKIALKVNKDNGTTKEIGYSSFSMVVTYDPRYLALYDGKHFELSNAASAKNLNITRADKVDSSDKKEYQISVLETQKSDSGIDVYGDFLYLSFVPAAGKTWEELRDKRTAVEIAVMSGVDQFGRSMTTYVNGDHSITPPNDKGDNGGIVKFDNVEFVKSLYKFGDVNNDTYVNLIDAVMILKYYNGDMSLTEDQLARANVNDDYWNQDSTDSSGVHKKGDPLVTLVDAVLIVECYNGTRSEDDLPYTRTN